MTPTGSDDVLARRARAARAARAGQRIGYLAFLASLVVFGVGMATDFTEAVATSLIILLGGGSVVLAPSIVLHHAVRAAEADDAAGKAPAQEGPRPPVG